MHCGERLVVDASVAAKWFLPDEEDTDRANGLLIRATRDELILLAPDIIWPEVSSAITVATRGRAPRLGVEAGERHVARWLAIGMGVYYSRDLLLSAYQLVHQHGCAIYDALYLALADRLDVPFITADRRLYQRVGHVPSVLWLGDDAPWP